MTRQTVPSQSRADDGGPTLHEVIRLLTDQKEQIGEVRNIVDGFPDRMDERYHRKELVDSRLEAITDRLNRADAWRQLLGGAAAVELLAIVGAYVLPH